VSNKNEEATLPTYYQIRKRRYQLSLIQAVSVRPFVILFHQFHNKILQSSLKTFHEPRRANQNVHMANLFHGLRKHTIVSNIHRYSTVTRNNCSGTQTRRRRYFNKNDVRGICSTSRIPTECKRRYNLEKEIRSPLSSFPLNLWKRS